MPIHIPDYLADLPAFPKSPVEILRQAAEQFGKMTSGSVEATVFTLNPGGSTQFRHTFYLVVPSLDDYTDALFYVWHSARLYPATLLLAGGRQGKDEQSCKTPKEFEEELARIFDSSETRQRIYTLIDLAQGSRKNVLVQGSSAR